ncbi:MAG TPA: Gfo/Idh/MocA family oxidoreductase [Candidatus Merdivicinus intestinigallinarum]|nr:Gfo/Idh/MocA family oxidoreductase [Candidatus Merdivicinus intestinigallinarum]
MKEKLKIGVIGLGGRGYGLMTSVMLPRPEIDVIAVCDLYEDRRQKAADTVKQERGIEPLCTADYREVLAIEELDAVIISASWADHLPIAIAAMKAGKYVGCEVGGAYSLDECWELVRTYEETGVPCMLMENCCYGRDELMVLNMVKQGLFGEIVHCQGGYRHDLRDEVAYGRENRHYRLVNYQNRNCENYPTHELGPIAKVLNINRGNRMVSLNSVASKSAGLHEFLMQEKGPEYDLSSFDFAQGDVVTTIIKCAHGETITLTLDTTLPRAYSRGFHVQGTKGMYMEDNRTIFLDGVHNKYDFCWKDQWNNVEGYREQYDHPIWKQYLKEGVTGGHDGIDWLVFGAFFDAVKKGVQTPIDVYDMAAWMSITPLSEASIAMGGAPVAVPDFTNGRWIDREPIQEGHYCLEKICE